MGCCQSRTSDSPDDVVPGHHAGDSSSSRAINAPSHSALDHAGLHSSLSRPQSNLSTTSRPSHSTTRRTVPTIPLSEHYNQPIRPHVWKSKRRAWSRIELAREREEFFETRVTGRPEIWAALSTAISLMRDGDLATAQTIIDAAGVTVPTGDLCEGCYDENGALYRLPECIVSDPEDVLDSPGPEETKYQITESLGEDEVSSSKLAVDVDSDEELVTKLERRREEKGKRNERDLVKVSVRLSDRGGPDLVVSIGKEQTAGSLARRVQSDARISGKKRVRLAYLGKMLNEHETLLSQGWKESNIVNGLVVNTFN